MGILSEAASKLERQRQAKVKDPLQFKIVEGTDKGHWDAPQIISGKGNL